jgi:hypothetical protein
MSNGSASTEVSIAEMIITAEITSRSQTRQAACAHGGTRLCDRVNAWRMALKRRRFVAGQHGPTGLQVIGRRDANVRPCQRLRNGIDLVIVPRAWEGE